MTEAFPLTWPAAYPRTQFRKRAAFSTGFARARDGLLRELRLLRTSHVVISSNLPLRRDGLPYAGQAQPRDPGVAVYFMLKGKQVALACDRWDRVEDNLHAIEETVEAMRGMDRWGVSQMLERAFAGFTALPDMSQTKKVEWWHILDCEPTTTLQKVEAIYREYVKTAHPDRGGSHEEMTRLNWAIAEARKARGTL